VTLGIGEVLYPNLSLIIAYQVSIDLTAFPTLMFVISILLLLLGAFGRIDTKWLKAELHSRERVLVMIVGLGLLIFSVFLFREDQGTPSRRMGRRL